MIDRSIALRRTYPLVIRFTSFGPLVTPTASPVVINAIRVVTPGHFSVITTQNSMSSSSLSRLIPCSLFKDFATNDLK